MAHGAILDVNGNVIGPGNPARAGYQITVYCTGLGELQQPVNAGDYGPATSTTKISSALTIGGQSAAVRFNGLAPSPLVGIYFVQAIVPAGVPAGDAVPIIMISLGAPTASSPVATMAITN